MANDRNNMGESEKSRSSNNCTLAANASLGSSWNLPSANVYLRRRESNVYLGMLKTLKENKSSYQYVVIMHLLENLPIDFITSCSLS